MNKFALIGKNISHSKSKEVYEKLLNSSVDYTLLDYNDSSDIEDLKVLLKKYQNISITAPYKNYVFSKIDKFIDNKLDLDVVNAIKLDGDRVLGCNTDIIAFEKIYLEKFCNYDEVVILGDGSISKMIQAFFKFNNKKFLLTSRKIDQFDLLNKQIKPNVLYINTCAREYSFIKSIHKSSMFWDMNYSLDHHIRHFASKNLSYFDGYTLLLEQARSALSFWN